MKRDFTTLLLSQRGAAFVISDDLIVAKRAGREEAAENISMLYSP